MAEKLKFKVGDCIKNTENGDIYKITDIRFGRADDGPSEHKKRMWYYVDYILNINGDTSVFAFADLCECIEIATEMELVLYG